MNLYKDIATRTGGDVYIGVVGPVRTGKSTFVTKFMNQVVLPNVQDGYARARAVDEMPQSADGKTVMTTQPNFVPNVAVPITFGDKTKASVRLIDCVGYLIDGVQGHLEEDKPRLVSTPWSDQAMPFERAAEIGTEKVVKEHSTIAIVVTCDGSFSELPRENYVQAEARVISELKQLNKPFVVVLNTTHPTNSNTIELAEMLTEKYQTAVLPVDVANMTKEVAEEILQQVLQQFPVRTIKIDLPKWLTTLSGDHQVIADLIANVKQYALSIDKMYQCKEILKMDDTEDFLAPQITEMDMGSGVVTYEIAPQSDLFYRVLSKEAGCDVTDEYSLMNFVITSAYAKGQYEHVKQAFLDATVNGYGVVCPSVDEMTLQEPEIVKQGARYGVRLKATAPSFHIMKVDVNTEVSPIIGSEQQSQYLIKEFESNPTRLWQTNMFGKSLSDLAKEGLTEKCGAMPHEAQEKIAKTVSRIINDGKGGLICLLL
ncbi:MAG: stage IV sporulation protein A [Clostridia bacterium]|nr:stage IV sporulation protein A [Clostridia bacterium]